MAKDRVQARGPEEMRAQLQDLIQQRAAALREQRDASAAFETVSARSAKAKAEADRLQKAVVALADELTLALVDQQAGVALPAAQPILKNAKDGG
jgi:hypothetical protein